MKAENLNIRMTAQRGHERYWRVMLDLSRKNGAFSLRDMFIACPRKSLSVMDYMRRLEKAEIITHNGDETFKIIKSQSSAPRVRRDGTVLPEPINETLWRSMKMLKVFTAMELAAAATAKPSTAQSYCTKLAAAGVLSIFVKGKNGQETRYRLAKNLGAYAPRILRSLMVFDPNSNAIVGEVKAREVAA